MRKQTLLLTVFFLLIGLMTSTTWAQANGTITGFVYAPNGTTPLANAVVTLYPYYGVSTSVTTNALGIYTAEVAADAYRLKVEPVGYPWEYYGNTTDWYATPYVTLAAGATVGAIDFVVDAPASISGTVYAPDGTTPLSGVTVNMYFQTSGFWYAGTALTTNASGQYTAYVRPGTYTVNVRPLNYPAEYWDNQISLSSAASFAVNNGDTITGKNFTLDNGGFISGTIYEPNGVLPLAGATVSLYNDTGSLWLSSVLSDASGQYTIPARAGSFRIGVSKNGYNFQISLSSISVTAGATTSGVNFTLGATASISGTVTTGAPLVAQPISAYIADLGAPVIPDQTAVVASGEVAPVELDDAGQPILEGEQPERIETIVSPGAPDVLDIERAYLVQQGVLTEEIVYGFVEVFNATTGATVTTAPLNAVGAYTAYLALSENSNFRVRGNVAGYVREYYGGKFQASQADAVAVAVGQQVTGIDIQLEAAGTITGTIFGSGGVPLAGRFVDWLLNGYDNKTTCTDSSGNYQLTGVPLNAGVRVRAWGPYSCSGTATNLYTQYWTTSTTFAGGTAITLTPGSPTIGGVNFTLQTGGIVTGTITNAFTGAPIVGGTITAFDPATANFLNNTGSNSSGAYTLLGIRPGNTWFRGTALSYIEEYYNNKTTQLNADQVAVTTGGTVPNINFTLDPTTGIRGTVYAPNGTTTVAGATVIAYDSNGTLRGSTTTNGSGFYQLYAGAGSFKLEVRSSSYPTEFYADQLTFATANSVNVSTNNFTENINFTLDAGGVITGHITEADGTTPIANVNLDTYEQVGGVIYTATTDASGNYRIPVRPGAYRVRAWEPGYVIEYYAGVLKAANASVLNVTDGATLPNIDFQLDQAGTVSGFVYEADGVTPAANSVSVWFVTPDHDVYGWCSSPNGSYTVQNIPLNTPFKLVAGDSCTPTDLYLPEWWQESATEAGATALTLTAGNRNLTGYNFTLDPATTISGHVYETDGTTPINGALVELKSFDGSRTYTETTSATGAYSFLVPAGSYFANAMATDHATEWYDEQASEAAANQIVGTTPGGIVTDINFTLDTISAPPATTLIAPVGNVDTGNPVFTWDDIAAAQQYQIWVGQVDGAYSHQEWIPAAGNCDGDTCSFSLADTLTAGVYDWWVQTWNQTGGEGAWSSPLRFTVTVTPPAPVAVAPVGGTLTTQPVQFSFNSVPGASWYYLWLSNGNGYVLDQWYPAAGNCTGGVCTITPAVTFVSSAYQWWVQAWSEIYGYTEFNGGSGFIFGDFTTPAPVAPVGVVNPDTDTPTFTWSDVAGLDWYHLWVSYPDGSGDEFWFQDGDVCNGTDCSATPVNADFGIHTWWVQGYANGTYTNWSSATYFERPLGTPAPTSPVGTITTGSPTFTWNSVPGSYWYYLWISVDPDGSVLDQWYNAYDICTDINSGVCSVTPALNLPNGNYIYWLKGWSPIGGEGAWTDSIPFTVAAPVIGGEVPPAIVPTDVPPAVEIIPTDVPPTDVPIEPPPPEVGNGG